MLRWIAGLCRLPDPFVTKYISIAGGAILPPAVFELHQLRPHSGAHEMERTTRAASAMA